MQCAKTANNVGDVFVAEMAAGTWSSGSSLPAAR